jgi:hypothetical protein
MDLHEIERIRDILDKGNLSEEERKELAMAVLDGLASCLDKIANKVGHPALRETYPDTEWTH